MMFNPIHYHHFVIISDLLILDDKQSQWIAAEIPVVELSGELVCQPGNCPPSGFLSLSLYYNSMQPSLFSVPWKTVSWWE